MTLRWRKASKSVESGSCVEVANHLGAVRDSKNPEVVLGISPGRLKAFVEALKSR
ncbi:uncharacterized protein DUF397 [Saccharothrix saharensis]|uniref:Uncharacterized protein DUF397 n=1 Tax=Saccharothrix saharensis TaxID=571190 RepID=A0A543JCT3_9PSEU|nr:DUF397 domain-containing protein [Saccharothrix saharensis]TQM80632.1 uncharacterized protein DUF397 [Saccharothrix saharensis]